MKTALRPALPLLACPLASCDKPAAPAAPGAAPDGTPGVSLSAGEIPFSSSVKGREFRVSGCTSLRVRLLHLVSGEVRPGTEHPFEGLDPTFDGSLWLPAQDGESFGRTGPVSDTPTRSMKAGSVLTASRGPVLLEGPCTMTPEGADSSSSSPADQEHVVFRRLLSKVEGSQSFESGGVETLAKQTAGKALEILAVALPWE